MSGRPLQDGIDRLRAASRQRWVFATTAVVAAVIASAVAVDGAAPPLVWLVLVVSSVVAAMQPETHVGLFVVAIVAWQWLVAVEDVATLRSVIVALALLVFHSALALMAVTPETGVIHRNAILRWSYRVGWVAASTGAVWALVVVFDRRDAQGSALLTMIGLIVVAVSILVLRHRLLAPVTDDAA